jgi:glycosyltransferase involved in cell wall biosynthesis
VIVLRILLVLPVNNIPGKTGDSVHIYNLCKAWAASGHVTHIVALRSKHQKKVFDQNDGVIVHRLPFTLSPINQLTFDTFKSIIKLPFILITALLFSLSLMLTQDFDLLFVRYRPPFSSISIFISTLTGKSLITKFAGTAVYNYVDLPFEKAIFKLLIKKSTFLITDNSYMAKVFKKEIPEHKLKNIQPPVSLELFSTQLLENQNKTSKKFVVLYVSSFRKDEDVTKFVLASRVVLKKFPDVSFVMVGDGVTKPAAVKLSEQLGLKSAFSFLGSVPHYEIPHLIDDSDLLVALYVQKYKAIPIKILEYGAARKPIVTTRNVAAIFENEINTFKAKDNFYVVNLNVKSIADALGTLYKDETLRNRIATNMHNMVVKNFSLNIISDKYLSIFEETQSICSGANHRKS